MGLDAGYGIGSLKPGVCTSSTRPASPYVGQTIFETDTNKMKVWLGSNWSSGTLHEITLAVDVLVVAGGGGSGYGNNAGGGGGGGLLYGSLQLARNSSTTISVGSGGTTSYASIGNGTNGVNSTVVINSTTYTALGGGSGSGNSNVNGSSGGSGGGGGNDGTTSGTGGSATQTSSNPFTGYGNAGASGGVGRGGGGAGGAGSGQTGGAGLTYFGATYSVGGTGSSTNVAGGANTGNGGSSGGAGGSGVVVVRYLTTDASGITITGGTSTTSGSYTIRTFTASGTLAIA